MVDGPTVGEKCEEIIPSLKMAPISKVQTRRQQETAERKRRGERQQYAAIRRTPTTRIFRGCEEESDGKRGPLRALRVSQNNSVVPKENTNDH